MAARRERELEQRDTQVDLALDDDEEEEGRTQPFTEVARAEAALERSRERVERSVSALREAVARRADWRSWVARRPGTFLGAAVLLGFALGFRWRGGRAAHWR
jgi:hypothetical protein